MRRLTSVLIFLLLTTALLWAQAGGGRIPDSVTSGRDLHTPERGSDEPKAIMDALRMPVEKKLRQQVIFKIDHLKSQNGWAFLLGKPQRLDGTRVVYSGTCDKEAVAARAICDGIVALLQQLVGTWRLRRDVIGAT